MLHDTELTGGNHPGTSPTAGQSNGRSVSLAMNAPRPPFFANRVLRLAIKTTLAEHLGPDVVSLLTVIVMTEDARRYRGPVAFWNPQLLQLVGFAKWDRLERARSKAIDADWLLYVPGTRHRAGLYRVTIPKELEAVEDAPVDEGPTPGEGYQAGYKAGYRDGFDAGRNDASSPFPGVETGNIKGSTGISRGDQRGEREGEPSSLVPIPKTSSPTKRDVVTNSEVEAVEVLLANAGFTTAGTTARLSVDRRYTRNDLTPLLHWLKSHPDLSEGALVFRLKNSPPTTPIDQGWPRTKAKPQADGYAKLETQFGPKLSRMSESDLRSLCELAGLPDLSESEFDQCRANPTTKRKLIEQLAREHSSRSQDDKPP